MNIALRQYALDKYYPWTFHLRASSSAILFSDISVYYPRIFYIWTFNLKLHLQSFHSQTYKHQTFWSQPFTPQTDVKLRFILKLRHACILPRTCIKKWRNCQPFNNAYPNVELSIFS